MRNEIFELKHIFGLKIKEIRQEKSITYHDLREKTGLSVSYLSEIENGKKYPKGDKIILLSEALGVSYDQLVSLKVPKRLQPIVDLIQSDFFKAFPMQEFGLNPQKIVEIVSHDPEKINAFINTVFQIARNFEVKNEHFYYAALRSYQELQDNYFDQLERSAQELLLDFPELVEIPFTEKTLTQILLQLGVRVNREGLKDPLLKNIRSIYHEQQRLLYVNKGLTSGQNNFLLAREVAFQWLKIKNRPFSTPPVGEQNFESILNNYKSSYFAAAIMMPEQRIVRSFGRLAEQERWNGAEFLHLLKEYDVTPEMLMQRLTNILPTHFGIKNLFFLRFLSEDEGKDFTLTKELHLSGQHNPHANELNEHYCRRWVSIALAREVQQKKKSAKGFLERVQISKYWGTANEYICIALAFPNVSNDQEAVSVTVGFLLNKQSREQLKFVSDNSIPVKEVNTTCERCPIQDCKERAAPPSLHEKLKRQSELIESVQEVVKS